VGRWGVTNARIERCEDVALGSPSRLDGCDEPGTEAVDVRVGLIHAAMVPGNDALSLVGGGVALVDDTRTEDSRFEQPEPDRTIERREEPRALPEHHRVDDESVFVDEAALDELGRERWAADFEIAIELGP